MGVLARPSPRPGNVTLDWVILGIRPLAVTETLPASIPGEDAVTLTAVCVQHGATVEHIIAYRRVGDTLVVQLDDERVIRAKV